MANINIVPGINVITYRGSNPLNFSAIPNFDNNINYVRSPDCRVRAGNVYQNFQSYFPGAGPLNDWLTNFASISSYIVFAKSSFVVTEQGVEVTTPQLIRVTAPLALVGIDSNRVNTVPVSASDSILTAVYWHDGTNWLPYRPGLLDALNVLNGPALPSNIRNNWLPGRTYYVVCKTGTQPFFLDIPRLRDYLLADNYDFLRTDTYDNLCLD